MVPIFGLGPDHRVGLHRVQRYSIENIHTEMLWYKSKHATTQPLKVFARIKNNNNNNKKM